ncbi:hypothetical protein B296_00032783 [Ensete ventricosum]|uniref:Transmembrane protein n=1 Tax=Ensete ventricosum TaxID=4639 RepID=A0A427AAA1_ENSVE|nr:hypothetical protein B296_00032783 [Ensete ventricosum]
MACSCGGAAAWALPRSRCSLPLDLLSSPRAPNFPGRWNAVPLSSRFFFFSSYPVISSNTSSALFCGGAQAARDPPSAAPSLREICRGKVPEQILQRLVPFLSAALLTFLLLLLPVRGSSAIGRYHQKSIVGGRLREKSIVGDRLRVVGGRLREKKGRRRRTYFSRTIAALARWHFFSRVRR